MAIQQLTTGVIENQMNSSGIRPTKQLIIAVKNDSLLPVIITISGFFITGAPVPSGTPQNPHVTTLYVLKQFILNPTGVSPDVFKEIDFADLDELEFQFTIDFGLAAVAPGVEISVWGIDAAGDLVAAHRLVPAEIA